MNAKRILIRFFLLVAVLLPATVARAQFTFTTNVDTITITGYTGSNSVVVIPDTTNGYPVTSIGDFAFQFSGLTSVTIPGSVTSIGNDAFDSSGLFSLSIPGSVTNLGDWAFYGCQNLTNVTIGNSVLGGNEFEMCTNLNNVTLTNTINRMGVFTFSGCSSLTNITLGNTVTNIPYYSLFYDCFNLMSISVDSNNPTYSSQGGVLFDKHQTTLIEWPEGKTGDYTMPLSATNINQFAFIYCTNLVNLYFLGNAPDAVTNTIYGANSTTVYYLPGTTGWTNFAQLSGILTVLWNPPVPFNYTINNGAITITGYTGSNSVVTIPDKINSLPVTSIGSGAFSTTIVTGVKIPESVTSIEDTAFYGCVNLASITIPTSVTNIGAAAFNSCLRLRTVTIPASVTSIGDYAFFYCTNLTAINVAFANPRHSSAQGVLFNKRKTVLMQFPFAKAGSYAIPGTVTNLADEAFGINDHGNPFYSSCVGLTNLIIPSSIKQIGNYAFSHCDGLTSVKLSQGIASLGVEAFSWCSSLHSIIIPDSVRNIGDVAFYYAGLKQVTIPGSVTNLGIGAFAVCSNLTIVMIQNGVTGIGEAGFNFCTHLTSVYLPDSLKSIGERAFWFCTGLNNVTIPRRVASIGSYAFSGCASLKKINVSTKNPFYSSVDGVLCSKDRTTLIQFPGGRSGTYQVPNGITTIGDYAFGTFDPGFYSFDYLPACANLDEIIFPSSIVTIGFEDFNSLPNLTSAYFEGGAAPTELGDLPYDSNVTIYYLPAITSKNTALLSIPATPWLPQMKMIGNRFGGQNNKVGFNIQWASGKTVVVEASTNLINWQPVQTNTLTSGSASFSDPQWTNYPGRFYRLCSP